MIPIAEFYKLPQVEKVMGIGNADSSKLLGRLYDACFLLEQYGFGIDYEGDSSGAAAQLGRESGKARREAGPMSASAIASRENGRKPCAPGKKRGRPRNSEKFGKMPGCE